MQLNSILSRLKGTKSLFQSHGVGPGFQDLVAVIVVVGPCFRDLVAVIVVGVGPGFQDLVAVIVVGVGPGFQDLVAVIVVGVGPCFQDIVVVGPGFQDIVIYCCCWFWFSGYCFILLYIVVIQVRTECGGLSFTSGYKHMFHN